MKVFKPKLWPFYEKYFLIMTLISIMILMACSLNLNAQKESNAKLKIEIGLLWDFDTELVDVSPVIYVEPSVKISNHTTIGLRIGFTENRGRIDLSDPTQFYNGYGNDDGNGNGSTIYSMVPTFDYYFQKNTSRPYLGVGIGYHFLNASEDIFPTGNTTDIQEVEVSNQVGFLLRGGVNLNKVKFGRFDLNQFIVGLEFNYIPKANINLPNGQTIGTIATSNVVLTFGYIIGGRKVV